jgi:hypothetical protein
VRVRVSNSAPEKITTRPVRETFFMFNNPVFSRKKVIKDYVYTPEYRVIAL